MGKKRSEETFTCKCGSKVWLSQTKSQFESIKNLISTYNDIEKLKIELDELELERDLFFGDLTYYKEKMFNISAEIEEKKIEYHEEREDMYPRSIRKEITYLQNKYIFYSRKYNDLMKKNSEMENKINKINEIKKDIELKFDHITKINL